MFETAQSSEFDMPYEMTHEQWVSALAGEREPQRREYVGDSLANAERNVNRQYVADGIDELERHANNLATRENIDHDRDVENARTIGQVATLVCTYRDYERTA